MNNSAVNIFSQIYSAILYWFDNCVYELNLFVTHKIILKYLLIFLAYEKDVWKQILHIEIGEYFIYIYL